jgi:hypothetical protein
MGLLHALDHFAPGSAGRQTPGCSVVYRRRVLRRAALERRRAQCQIGGSVVHR